MRATLTSILLAAVLVTSTAGSVRADDAASARRQDQFKAAYLFNFVKFVEWPQTPSTETITVCFAGGNGVQEAFSTDLEAKRVGSHRLAVSKLDANASAAGCNALYIDSLASIAALPMTSLPVLTVSDAQSFSTKGGMIELFTDNNRLRFSINVDNAQRSGLRISSDLLKLAAAVYKESK